MKEDRPTDQVVVNIAAKDFDREKNLDVLLLKKKKNTILWFVANNSLKAMMIRRSLRGKSV